MTSESQGFTTEEMVWIWNCTEWVEHEFMRYREMVVRNPSTSGGKYIAVINQKIDGFARIREKLYASMGGPPVYKVYPKENK